jgi:outer membrane protein TolC
MKRWKTKLATLLLFGGLAGCKQPLYMTVDDQKAVTVAGLPRNLENDPNVTAVPAGNAYAKPADVDHPDRPARYMTLPEAIAVALEQGTRGNQSSAQVFQGARSNFIGNTGFGVYADDLVTSTGRGVIGDDSIRAFALDPAIIGADIEGALAKFDTRWLTTMNWQKNDTAVTNVFNNLSNGDTGALSSGLFKPLPTGGLAGITWNTNYTKLTSPPSGFQVVNPAYQPSLNFTFEQPLLRGYGININQLLPSHPGSVQQSGFSATGGRAEGILITRIRFEQSKNEFERTVNVMLFNVEFTYWGLYASYFALYAAEQGLRQAYVTWQLKKSELEAGKATAHEVAQVRAQFANFRGQRVQALQNVLNWERQLRGILNLPVEDGKRLVPADAPTLSPYNPDWTSSVSEALANRPELLIMRQEVKARQFDLMVQQNFTRPDLRFVSSYNVNGIGTRLDGSGSNNAIDSLVSNKFNTWLLGLRLDVPIGTRDAYSSVRAAQLNLARSFILMKNQEEKAARYLAAVNQQLFSSYRLIEYARERRQALADQLRGLYARIQAGKDPLITILQAQSDFATALQNEHDAIANYNIAIAGFQYAKGTIMQYNNVQVADGPLPACVMTRAADHFRQRGEGLVAREREHLPSGDGPHPLPSLLEHQPETPKTPPELQNLPAPSPAPFDPMTPVKPAVDPKKLVLPPPLTSGNEAPANKPLSLTAPVVPPPLPRSPSSPYGSSGYQP